ncbi:hypothetical protein J4227_08035, partial [Candidatus Woesearchaeota archaeon]|nr:hypothetical protein [Candidatus Woesearchaeota archaeon]
MPLRLLLNKAHVHKQPRALIFALIIMLWAMAIPCSMAQEIKGDFEFSVGNLEKVVQTDTFEDIDINVKNRGGSTASLYFGVDEKYANVIRISTPRLTINPGDSQTLRVVLVGDVAPDGKRTYETDIKVKGDLFDSLPVKLVVSSASKVHIESFYLEESAIDKEVNRGKPLAFRINMHNLLSNNPFNVTLKYALKYQGSEELHNDPKAQDEMQLDTTQTLIKSFPTDETFPLGDYNLDVTAYYLNTSQTTSALAILVQPFYMYRMFGFFPLWWLLPILLALVTGTAGYIIVRKKIEEKKKYH